MRARSFAGIVPSNYQQLVELKVQGSWAAKTIPRPYSSPTAKLTKHIFVPGLQQFLGIEYWCQRNKQPADVIRR
jgi:hypothetical protein